VQFPDENSSKSALHPRFLIAMIAFPLSRDAVFKHAVRYESPVEGAVTIATALVTMWLTSMAWVFIEPRPESEVVLDLLTELGDRFSGQILRWISCMRRRATRLRLWNPRTRFWTAFLRRPTKRVTTRTTSHNKVLSVGW